jgi:putative ABC transport system permease protein
MVRVLASMGTFIADLRHSLRTLRKSPGFAAVAVLTLALGIGANTAIFSVIDQVLLRPLPFHDSERILRVQRHFPNGDGSSTSIPKFMAWKQAPAFQSMAMYDFGGVGVTIGDQDHPEQAGALHVTSAFFDVFGVTPAMGRTFRPQEDLPNAGKFTVLTHDFWKNRLGGDPALVGRTILLSHEPYLILGVLPADYQPDPPADLYLPLQVDPNSTNQGHIYITAGRLRPGATVEEARAQLNTLGERFRRQYPDTMDKTESVGAVTLRQALGGDVKQPLLILGGAVGFVLLIACANVANLLLARAAGRRREIAIRAAVGASRGRIVRQLLTESLLLALAGGAAGFFAGAAGVRALLAASPGDIPRITGEFSAHSTVGLLDWRILAFTIGASVLTGILFGLLPAVHVSRIDVNASLKESSGRSGTGLKQSRVRGMLVVSEIALALVLLVGAALMIRTLAGLRSVQPGFDARNILTFKVMLGGGRYDKTTQAEVLVRQATQRIEGLPGVQAAAMTFMLPLENGLDLPFIVEGRTPANGKYEGDEYYRPVSAHYFTSLRIPLRKGRLLDDRDTSNSPRVVVINELFAKKYFKTGDPIGQRINIGKGLGPEFEESSREIVGIVGGVHENGLDNDVPGVMYVPAGQVTDGITKLANSLLPLSWLVRTQSNPLDLVNPVQRELQALDSQLGLLKVRTMEQVMVDSTTRTNFQMLLLTVFATVALVLAAVGIYGLLAYTVQQRTQEIGIRMALGADRATMLRLVLGQGMRLAAIGIAIGLAVAYGVTRVLSGLLFSVKASDPMTFALVAAILATVAMLAALIPARRATRIDPVIAMRAE